MSKDPEANRRKCREYRQKNIEKLQAYDRERHKAPARREAVSANSARWRDRNPDLHAERRRQWYQDNAQLCRDRARRWAAKNADHVKDRNLRKVGFTLKLKRETIELQGFACAICRVDFGSLPTKKVCADHCHSTGKPRGVLCSKCNSAIGYFKDDPELLRAAIAYLENPPLKNGDDCD